MATQRFPPEEATSISLLQASTLQEMELQHTAGDMAAFGEPPVSSNMENAGKYMEKHYSM